MTPGAVAPWQVPAPATVGCTELEIRIYHSHFNHQWLVTYDQPRHVRYMNMYPPLLLEALGSLGPHLETLSLVLRDKFSGSGMVPQYRHCQHLHRQVAANAVLAASPTVLRKVLFR